MEKILGQNAFWIINKELAKTVGIEGALLLSDLIDKYSYFKSRGELTEDGFFYNTAENIEQDTTLSYHKQKKYLKILEEKGFITTDLRGIPAKTFFKINENKLKDFMLNGFEEEEEPEKEDFKNKFLKNSKTGFKKILKLDLEKFKTNNNKEIIINNNNKDNSFNKLKQLESCLEETEEDLKNKTGFKENLNLDLKQKQEEKNNLQEKPAVKMEEKKMSKSQYGNPEINQIIETIKKYNDGLCSGTQREQRRYGKLLLNKLKKFTKENYDIFEAFDILLKILSDDEFYSPKIVGPKEIYYNFEKLVKVAKIKAKKQKEKQEIEELKNVKF